jgi:KamA family protein
MNRISKVDNTVLEQVLHVEESKRFKVYTQKDLDKIPQLESLSEEVRFEMKVVSSILPFRVNRYVIEELIEWDKVPNDPIYQLTFPQRPMLPAAMYDRMADLLRTGATPKEALPLAQELRAELNPHPAGQMEMNIPRDPANGERLNGLQHKYRETVLFFPGQGQTCHSYCTFCFRWAQFVGDKNLRIASTEADALHRYLEEHQEVTDLLVTGGDPMVMKTKHLASYLDPLTSPEFDHIKTIRLGTKALTFWPHRFVTDADADELINLFSRLIKAGKHVALMAHFNHSREMSTDIALRAIERIRRVGVEIRSQAPVLAHINDSADAWAKTWKKQVNAGIIPYYMFIERDTGASHYFEIPLARVWEIYRDAIRQLSGIGRTARGPVMSAGPGKVEVQGVAEVSGEKVFVLRFLQARNPEWTHRPFFAKYSEDAFWLDQLKPAFGEKEFFFEQEYAALQADMGTEVSS